MKPWIPCPRNWVNLPEWHALTPRARVLLMCLWYRTLDGRVPEDSKAVQILAGVPDRPKRIATAVQELKDASFIVQELDGFFLAQYRTIFAKFNKNKYQNFAKNKRKNTNITTESSNHSRARALPLKGVKKIKEEKRKNASDVRSSFSSELDPRIFDVKKRNQ